MTCYICATCGVQFAQISAPPDSCPICEDERQYVGHDGQQWTTLSELKRSHHNRIERQADGLYGIGTEPGFAIGQRSLLVQTEQGNVMWDCISLIDDDTIKQVQALGGIGAIAISHPHYYGSAVEWAHAFDAKVYIHAADRQWMMRSDPDVEFWTGDTLKLHENITLIKAGGHFAGGTVCHCEMGSEAGASEAGASEASGVLLTGDVIQVVADRRWVSFMYSYPNFIPLSASKVQHIVEAVEPYAFERIYGAWWTAIVASDAKESVRRSAERYIAAIRDDTVKER